MSDGFPPENFGLLGGFHSSLSCISDGIAEVIPPHIHTRSADIAEVMHTSADIAEVIPPHMHTRSADIAEVIPPHMHTRSADIVKVNSTPHAHEKH